MTKSKLLLIPSVEHRKAKANPVRNARLASSPLQTLPQRGGGSTQRLLAMQQSIGNHSIFEERTTGLAVRTGHRTSACSDQQAGNRLSAIVLPHAHRPKPDLRKRVRKADARWGGFATGRNCHRREGGKNVFARASLQS